MFKSYKRNVLILNLILFLNYFVVYCVDTKDNQSNTDNNIATENNAAHTEGSGTGVPIALKALFNTNYNETPKTIVYAYMIGKEDRPKMAHPNRFDRIEFKNHVMEFDENAKLPDVNPNFLSVFTCEHNNPIVFAFYTAEYGLYFYALDKNTNKWTNYKITREGVLEEHTDANNVFFYKKSEAEGAATSTSDKDELADIINARHEAETCDGVEGNDSDEMKLYLK